MKIVIDARFYGLENAGLGRYVMNLTDSLQSLDLKNNYILLLRRKYQNLNTPPKWEKIIVDFKHYSLSEQIFLPKIISNLKPDIVHFPHFNVPVLYRGKYVVTIHDLLMHYQKGSNATTLPLPLYLIKRMAYKFTFGKAVTKAKKIIVPSQFVEYDLKKHYKIQKEKINVVYEGISNIATDKHVLMNTSKKYLLSNPYFLYVGNAYPHKNLNRVIEAIAELNVSQKVDFVIVSARGAFTKRLEKSINKLGANNYVKLLGYVEDQELDDLYKNSIGFIYPSLMEGFGLPGLEALNSGTLVLASDIPVFKEVYKNHVAYFNPYDYSSIRKAMESAIDVDEKTRKLIIDRGKKFANIYSWRKMAEETLKVYESCVGLRQS